MRNPERRSRAGRRRGDKWGPILRENWYRDIWLLGVSAFVVIAVLNSQDAVDQQKEGRKVAVAAICGATSAVIEAGRATITGGAAGISGEFERNLRELGYPPRKIRQEQAEQAAQMYARTIAEGVRASAGKQSRGLVRKDGTLNCQRLQQVARTR